MSEHCDFFELFQFLFRPEKPLDYRTDSSEWTITSFRSTCITPVPERTGILVHVCTSQINCKVYLIKVPTLDYLFDIYIISKTGTEENVKVQRFVKPENILQVIANLIFNF